MKKATLTLVFLWTSVASAGYRLDGVAPVALGALEGAGQVADLRVSPDARFVGFEILGSSGETLEVYVAAIESPDVFPPKLSPPEPILPRKQKDLFSLQDTGGPVSEHVSWGPPKRQKPRLALAATRKSMTRGAAQVNFDLFLSEPGRRRFLTDHPENDAQPAFSPDGEFIAFASGRTGQGDIYLYHFFAPATPLVRLTYEEAGSEIFPAWDRDGNRLAFVAHLGGEDHILVVDDVRGFATESDESLRKAAARRRTRDLTPGWRGSCLAPSISPDGMWVAFYARERAGEQADLYVVPSAGGTPRLVLEKGLPESRGGPRWSPGGDGLFAVREDAERMNPMVWVPLGPGGAIRELNTGTELNADPFPVEREDAVLLWFTAQGGSERVEKRWRRVHVARLIPAMDR